MDGENVPIAGSGFNDVRAEFFALPVVVGNGKGLAGKGRGNGGSSF